MNEQELKNASLNRDLEKMLSKIPAVIDLLTTFVICRMAAYQKKLVQHHVSFESVKKCF